MRREDIRALEYITRIENIRSILTHGIYAHRYAQRFDPKSFALEGPQKKRARRRVDGRRTIHDYANLYFNGRNVTLYKRREQHAQLCILRVHPDVLFRPGVWIADRNAASDTALLVPMPAGLDLVDVAILSSPGWRHSNPRIEADRRLRLCAEVLVPIRVPLWYIRGAYVSCLRTQLELNRLAPELRVRIDPDLFFQ